MFERGHFKIKFSVSIALLPFNTASRCDIFIVPEGTNYNAMA